LGHAQVILPVTIISWTLTIFLHSGSKLNIIVANEDDVFRPLFFKSSGSATLHSLSTDIFYRYVLTGTGTYWYYYYRYAMHVSLPFLQQMRKKCIFINSRFVRLENGSTPWILFQKIGSGAALWNQIRKNDLKKGFKKCEIAEVDSQ
jgi:hypothetical protein